MSLALLLVACAVVAETIFAVPIAPIAPGHHQQGEHHQGQKNTDFDYYVFAQEWPYAMCHVANFHKPGSCAVPKQVDAWTIHGLWPSSLHMHEGPSNCDPSRRFEESQIADIMDQMERQWANVIPSTSSASFWEHEWSKHGTCAIEPSVQKGEMQYFNESLTLNMKHSIGKYLQQSGIEPSKTKTITLKEVDEAIQKITGKTFETHCLHINDKDDHTWYLLDVRMCLDKNLEPYDCPSVGHKMSLEQEMLELRGHQNGQHHESLPSPEKCPNDKPLYYVTMEQ